METSATKSEIGSPNPAVQSTGKESAGIVSEQGNIKVCKHPGCGCRSIKGYTCQQQGECDPVDAHGRHFSVRYIMFKGKPTICRTLESPLGTESFQYRKDAPLTLIDADIDTAARGIRGASAAIDRTLFRDQEPFSPEKFVNDRVAS